MPPEATEPVKTTGVETNETTWVTENKEATDPQDQDTEDDQISVKPLANEG